MISDRFLALAELVAAAEAAGWDIGPNAQILQAARDALAATTEFVEDMRDYLQDCEDIDDGADGAPVPTIEMRLLTRLDQLFPQESDR